MARGESVETSNFFKENRQLLFGIVLVIVIPLLVVVNSIIFFRRFTNTFDLELHRRAILVGEITSSFIGNYLNDPALLKESIDKTVRSTDGLSDVELSIPQGSDLIVTASVNNERVGLRETETAAFLAWQNKRPIAYRVVDRSEGRAWAVIYPITDTDERVTAVLKMRLSTEGVEQAASKALWQSFLILTLILIVILALLIVNSRIFQYAVLYRRLREVDRAKDEFISVASHELRTPITALKWGVSLFREGKFGKLSEKSKDAAFAMERSVEHLGNLVEDLLNVSRIQQGRIEIIKSRVDISKAVSDVVEELSPLASEKGLSLAFAPSKNIFILADSRRLKEIFMNLIGNAIKYTKKGSITVAVESEKNTAVIKVKDTGLGIAPDARERLFQKFFRVINKETEEIPGTGLGLWITKALIELMNGKIYIDSIEKVGTQVTVTFPLAEEKSGKR